MPPERATCEFQPATICGKVAGVTQGNLGGRARALLPSQMINLI